MRNVKKVLFRRPYKKYCSTILQKQLNIQDKMHEAINKKDESLEEAIKSMAESSTRLCNTLATTLQMVAHGAARQQTAPPPLTLHMRELWYSHTTHSMDIILVVLVQTVKHLKHDIHGMLLYCNIYIVDMIILQDS